MGKRAEPRRQVSVPVRIWGTDSQGKAFVETVLTLDVSRGGARLQGLKLALSPGGSVGLQHGIRRAEFTVAWAGEPGTPRAGQVGLRLASPKFQWDIPLPATREDSYDPALGAAEAPNAQFNEDDVQYANVVSARLQKNTNELRELERLLTAGFVDRVVLQEFREAVDQMRQTIWAVQRWVELKASKNNPSQVLPLIIAERVRVAIQLNRHLAADFAAQAVQLDTPGLSDLAAAVEALHTAVQQAVSAANAPLGETHVTPKL